jgi:phosphatidylserine decarboxylase
MTFQYNFVPKFSPHGTSIIFVAILITIFCSMLYRPLGVICMILTIFCLYFFRDPERKCFDEDGLVISSADGLVSFIGKTEVPHKFGLKGEMWKISIFLNVFDIHVNRLPINGVIKNIIYSPGKFISATNDKESDDNECNTLIIEDEKGNDVVVSQIAGLIARRIVCTAKTDEKSKVGERFGIIRFGSRVNIYLPTSFKILVQEGQRVIGGETIVGARDETVLQKIFEKSNKDTGKM